jgi:TfoX/Sxy family transcriptional regulator of competence genes
MAYEEQLAQRLRSAFKGMKGIAEKKMFGGISFLFKGNMVAGVLGSDLVSRCDPVHTDVLLKKRGARPFDPFNKKPGKPTKGWLLVGPEGLRKEKDLQAWVDLGMEYARSLPKK